MRFIQYFTLAAVVAISGCSSNETEGPDVAQGERKLYEQASSKLKASQYDMAIQLLQAIEANYPFGRYAEQAQLELIYAYHNNYEPDLAASSADRFIRLHPQHPNVDYAFYMKGLSAYSKSTSSIGRFFPIDGTKRDPGAARESFAHFAQLLQRFPDSQYVPDAEKRMVHLRNVLARYEIHVANYYFTRGAYLAAANRGRYVVENFQRTPAVADGLATMVQAYTLLNMDQQANDALTSLRTNYPNHYALDAGGNFKYRQMDKNDRSWLNQLTFGLADRPEPPGFDSRTSIDGQ